MGAYTWRAHTQVGVPINENDRGRVRCVRAYRPATAAGDGPRGTGANASRNRFPAAAPWMNRGGGADNLTTAAAAASTTTTSIGPSSHSSFATRAVLTQPVDHGTVSYTFKILLYSIQYITAVILIFPTTHDFAAAVRVLVIHVVFSYYPHEKTLRHLNVSRYNKKAASSSSWACAWCSRDTNNTITTGTAVTTRRTGADTCGNHGWKGPVTLTVRKDFTKGLLLLRKGYDLRFINSRFRPSSPRMINHRVYAIYILYTYDYDTYCFVRQNTRVHIAYVLDI